MDYSNLMIKFNKQHQVIKNNYERRFFQYINSEDKAYWMGFLLADGYLCLGINSSVVNLTLALKDINHLKKFIKSIDGEEKQLRIINNKGKLSVQCMLNSKEMALDMLYHGFPLENKSFTAKPLNFSNNLMRHFWRGMFDGDGTVCLMSSGCLRIALVGTFDICNGFSKFMGYGGNKTYKCGKVWRFIKDITKAKMANELYMKLYENSNLFLERKEKIWRNFIQNGKQVV